MIASNSGYMITKWLCYAAPGGVHDGKKGFKVQHMSYGQHFWQAKRTWSLFKDSWRAQNTISLWNPMSALDLALLAMILTVARIVYRFAAAHIFKACHSPALIRLFTYMWGSFSETLIWISWTLGFYDSGIL